jgi:hypothetical protein
MAGFNKLAAALHSWNAEEQEQRKRAAWEKAFPIPGKDPRLVRRDIEQRAMLWVEHGLKSTYGWEIDHITPLAIFGPDTLDNLRARHWKGNSSAGGRLAAALAASGIRGRPR